MINNTYLQDPSFNNLDVQFLQSRGHQILQSPQSDHLVTGNTFVFMPHPPGNVIHNILVAGNPAVVVSSKLGYHYWNHEIPRARGALLK